MIGLLWQRDHNDEPLATTLTRACQRYADRFGRWPTVALVPEGAPTDSTVLTLDGAERSLEVRATRRVPAGHVMVGIEGYDPSAPPVVRPTEETAPAVEPAEERPPPERVEVPKGRRAKGAEPAPGPVKRRSTMGRKPPDAPAPTSGVTSKAQPEQLSLWRKLKRERPPDSQ